MSLSNTLKSLEATVASAAIAAPSVSFKFGPSYEPRMAGLLVADVYAVKCDGYVEALFSSLEAVGIQYRAPEMKMLIKIYPVGGKVRVNIRTIGHPLSRIDGESITGWLDRVSMDERTKAIGIEIAAECLTKGQVKSLYANLNAPKFDAERTTELVRMFTFIAPPGLAGPAKQFKRSEPEHIDCVPLPALRVPANHVEPAAPIEHVEAVGDVPTFAIEPMIPVEEPIVDESVAIVEVDSLDKRTLRELGLLWKSEFGYNVPSKIRHADLCMLIEAKRECF